MTARVTASGRYLSITGTPAEVRAVLARLAADGITLKQYIERRKAEQEQS